MSKLGIFVGSKLGSLALTIQRELGNKSLLGVLSAMATEESANYVRANMTEAMPFPTKQELWEFALEKAGSSGMNLEFGVHEGASINFLAKSNPAKTWNGFDSFEGLAEDWPGIGMRKGAFDLGGRLPQVRNNVTLHKGWFVDSLPIFLQENPGVVRYLHLDADTYESTKYVLQALQMRLEPGAIIVFDEYFNYNGWNLTGEYKAFQEFCYTSGLTYRYLGFSEREVAVVISKLANHD